MIQRYVFEVFTSHDKAEEFLNNNAHIWRPISFSYGGSPTTGFLTVLLERRDA